MPARAPSGRPMPPACCWTRRTSATSRPTTVAGSPTRWPTWPAAARWPGCRWSTSRRHRRRSKKCVSGPGWPSIASGRLVEQPRPACRGLIDWYADVLASDGGTTLRTSAYADLARFLSPRFIATAPTLPDRAVIADVFLRFAQCAVGLTPQLRRRAFRCAECRVHLAHPRRLRTGAGAAHGF